MPEYAHREHMGLEQFERRLERMVEGMFARAFRGGLQPVEVGRRLTREMDLRRTIAPRGTLTPNQFTVVLSLDDYDRFAPIEDELLSELVAEAEHHADQEGYVFIGPVTVVMETDPALAPGTVLVAGEMVRSEKQQSARLLLPDGREICLSGQVVSLGRMPDCTLVLADPNVSRHHAEIHPLTRGYTRGAGGSSYEIADLGSTNGTMVNSVRLVAPVTLHDGDQISVGATTIRYVEA